MVFRKIKFHNAYRAKFACENWKGGEDREKAVSGQKGTVVVNWKLTRYNEFPLFAYVQIVEVPLSLP